MDHLEIHRKVRDGEIRFMDGVRLSGVKKSTFHDRQKKFNDTGAIYEIAPQRTIAPLPSADPWAVPTAKVTPAAPQPVKKAPSHGGKWKRFVAASDIHGDMQDKETCDVLWRFIDQWNPQLRFCLGDVWDFRPMRNGASNEEKSESMSADFQMGMSWLERFFGCSGEKYLNLGNHDARPYEWAHNRRGVERDFAAEKLTLIESEFARLGINWVPYHKRDGVIKVGHLRLIHGFHCGVYAARQAALIYGSCLMGHTHSVDEHHIPGLERRACRIIGALCRLDMDYNARQPNTLRQANGFAYGAINTLNGSYVTWQAESYDGGWLIPSDVVEL